MRIILTAYNETPLLTIVSSKIFLWNKI